MMERGLETTFQEILDMAQNKRLVEIKERFCDMNEVDIAGILERLPNPHTLMAFRVMPKEDAAEVFAHMSTDQQQHIIDSITDSEVSDIIDELFLDDLADILEELPSNVVDRVMRNTNADKRERINQLLLYPPNSAGSIMTSEFIDLRQGMSVGEAFGRIRTLGRDMETIYTCFVIDGERRLEGVVSIRELLLADHDERLAGIMDTNVISTHTLEDQERVAELFSRYDFLNLPVVDSEMRLVGIVTVDDVLDVISREATEDISKMGAVTPSGKSYMRTGVMDIYKSRIPWLLVLMISATLTGFVISAYETALDAHIVLAAFIPMLMDTGGNSGSQSAVIIIRAMSLGEVDYGDYFRILWKEIRVAVLCGVTLAFANFLRIAFATDTDMMVAAAVALTLVGTVLCSKAFGCSLPILARRIGVDPAVMSAPVITTFVDTISLILYFNIASLLLGI